MAIVVRPLGESDLERADQICRIAFGTYLGVPDPTTFMGDTDCVRTRWHADPSAAFGAFVDGELAGSVFVANWGSVGFFGPLTIPPDLWGRGIAKRLMEPVIGRFETWGTQVAGLFTFPDSAKHIGLYQRFGFWPRFLTAIMSRAVTPGALDAPMLCDRFSDVAPAERAHVLAECRDLTNDIYPGLDVTSEIRSVADQRLGDTLLLRREGRVTGCAICHWGAGSEAGSGSCYVKFAGVRPGAAACDDFDALLEACDGFAAAVGVTRLKAGVNTARREAYERMLARGFRVNRYGLAMQRPNEAGYNRPGVFVLDDWL